MEENGWCVALVFVYSSVFFARRLRLLLLRLLPPFGTFQKIIMGGLCCCSQNKRVFVPFFVFCFVFPYLLLIFLCFFLYLCCAFHRAKSKSGLRMYVRAIIGQKKNSGKNSKYFEYFFCSPVQYVIPWQSTALYMCCFLASVNICCVGGGEGDVGRVGVLSCFDGRVRERDREGE